MGSRPLAGYRVGLCTPGAAGLYAGWLLLGLGASVFADDVQDVAPELIAWLGEGFEPLEWASRGRADLDVVITDSTSGALAGDKEGCVFADVPVSVVVSPLGIEGPLATRRATSNEACALSGLTAQVGYDGEQPRPLSGMVIEFATGANAALAAAVGLYEGISSEVSSFRADVSMLETAVGIQGARALLYAQTGLVYRRPTEGSEGLRGFLRAADGLVGFSHIRWNEFLALLGIAPDSLPPEVPSLPEFERFTNSTVVALVEKALGTKSRAHWTEHGQTWRMPVLPVLEPTELSADPHLRSRGFWQERPGGALYPVQPFAGDRWHGTLVETAVTGEGRTASEDPAVRTTALPLDGMRVVEFGTAWSTPVAAQILAMYGADVVKVESARRADSARNLPLLDLALKEPWYEFSCNYQPGNAGKRNTSIDLTAPGGETVRDRLLTWADVVLTNFSARAIENLGLNGERVATVNPSCVAVHSTGFGRTGPYRQYIAYGNILEGMTGLSAANRGDSGRPYQSAFYHPDILASIHQALAAVVGAFHAKRSGAGATVDLAQLEVGVLPVLPTTFESRGVDPISVVIPTAAQAGWVALTLAEEEDVARLRAATGVDLRTWPNARSRRHELGQMLAGWSRALNQGEVESRLLAAGLACAAVLNSDEVLQLAHLRARKYFNWWERKEHGRRPAIGRWFRLADRAAPQLGPIHAFGEDNEVVALDFLRFPRPQYLDLVHNGVFATIPAGVVSPLSGSAAPLEWLLAEGNVSRRDLDYLDRVDHG